MRVFVNLFVGLFLMTGLVFSSCNKKNDENPANPGTSGTMKLKHDGSEWNASLSVQAVNTNGVVSITGSDSDANQGSVSVYNVSGPGTYKFGPGGNPGNMGRWTQGLGQNDSYMANHVIGIGEVTFTELTASKAKGTFHFEGYNTAQSKVTVTEGEFDVTF